MKVRSLQPRWAVSQEVWRAGSAGSAGVVRLPEGKGSGVQDRGRETSARAARAAAPAFPRCRRAAAVRGAAGRGQTGH